MSDLFKLKIVFSQSHTIVPQIIFDILIFFGMIILVQSIIKAKKENRHFLNLKGKKFFIEKYDKVKIYGTIVLLILYVFFMNILGFIISSIIFISAFNILYAEKKETKSMAISIGIAVIETMVIWFIFGYIFDITLP